MTRFVLSGPARNDLLEISDYISEKSGAEDVELLVSKLEDAMTRIASMPSMGHRRPDLCNDSLRVWPVWSYLIVYDPETIPLNVIRVLHGRRNVKSIFENEES